MNEGPKKLDGTAGPPPRLCPKCRGTMYCGFIPELRGDDEVTLLRWHFGNPDPALETGSNRPAPDQEIELYGGGLIINGFRCEACGYLELFAE